MRTRTWQLPLIVALGATLVVSSALAGGRASRTRPSGGKDGATVSAGRTPVAGRAARGTAPVRVSGRATYGHRGYGYRPYYAWGAAYPWHYGWYWGWPYYAWWAQPWPHYTYVNLIQRDRQAPGLVETDVRPKKAEVLVDGEYVGEARDYNGSWDVLDLPPGTRGLEFRLEGFKTLRIFLDVEAGAYYRVQQRLQRGEGLDERSMTPPPEPRVPAKQAARSEVVTTPPPAPAGESPGLAHGMLRVRATPRDAAVYLDGEFLAEAGELARLHGALPVAAGAHVIEVVRPGYTSRRVDLVVEADEVERIDVELEREE